MSEPVLVGKWYTRGNIPYSTVTTAANIAKSWLWMFKALLKGEVTTGTVASVISGTRGTTARPAGSYWTCEGSSNGTGTGAVDGTDRWTATYDGTKIVPGAVGVNHSWIVLKSPAALGPVYLCIDYCGPVVGVGDTLASAGIIYSYHPFTGGSRHTRPRSTISTTGDAEWSPGNTGTPADSHYAAFTSDLTLASTFKGNFTVNENGGFHFATARSTTGKFHDYQFADKAVGQTGDICKTWACFSTDTYPTRGTPAFSQIGQRFQSRTIDDRAISDLNSVQTFQFGSYQYAGTAPIDAISGKWGLLPIQMYDRANSTHRTASRGYIPDMYIIGNATVGASQPSAAAVQMTVVGDLLLPFAVVPTL